MERRSLTDLARATIRLRRRAAAARRRVMLTPALHPEQTWQRIVLNESVGRFLDGLGPGQLSAAEISGDAQAHRPWRRFVNLDYPAFDLCAPLALTHERYDVVICEQVLEHVLDPIAAARNLAGLLVPGGRAVVSTPFLVRVHELPAYGMPDFWRFTPTGLRRLLEHGGLVVDELHSWGNRDCVAANLDVWARFRPWHSLRDEPDLPLQVWAFTHRPD